MKRLSKMPQYKDAKRLLQNNKQSTCVITKTVYKSATKIKTSIKNRVFRNQE